MSPVGTGLNQTICPSGPRIISPSCPRPPAGVRKTSPGAVPGLFVVTSTCVGCNFGSVTSFCTLPLPTDAPGCLRIGGWRAVLATVNDHVPAAAWWAVTFSPGGNGLGGGKRAPGAPECPPPVPLARPLREPVTVTVPSWAELTPRKLICVLAEAVVT